MTYRDAAAWADALGEAVRDRRMPPWSADAPHGRFANDRRLSDADRETLLAWVGQGCVEGDPADLPPPRRFVEGWGIPKPDEVIAMNKEFAVPAQAPRGGVAYKYRLGGKPFTEEKWVQAVEVRPGNRALVHHVLVYLINPDKVKLPKGDEISDALGKKLFNDLPDGDGLEDPKGPRNI